MRSLRDCLCTILLSVSAQAYHISLNGWTMSGDDTVSAVEGAAAVLPCTFTHPPTNQTIAGSVMWYKGRLFIGTLVFKCVHPTSSHSRAGGETKKTGGSQFRLVGNLNQGDASVMVESLDQNDGGRYKCRVELNVGSFESNFLTLLSVTAPGEDGSVVTGTERASVSLPCVFTRPPSHPTPHTVTWMVKDPYRHVVTFRHRSNGSWSAESPATRYELVGDPEQGNASTRVNQLSVRDSHGYLCLVESGKPDDFRYRWPFYRGIKSPFSHLSQREVRLLVRPVTYFPVVILCIPLGLKILALLVMGIVFYRDNTRSSRD